MNVQKFNEIFNGKATKDIRKELKFIPTFENGLMKIKMSFPNRAPILNQAPCDTRYVEGKYIVCRLTLPNGISLGSILSWNDKTKSLIQWNFVPNMNKMWTFNAKRIEGGKYEWTGKTTDGSTYKGLAEYSKELLSFKGDYFKEGVLTHSEKGSISRQKTEP